MATNEWGMLRDIFHEVADAHAASADALNPTNPHHEARLATHLEIAGAFRRVAETMRARGGMTPDEIAAALKGTRSTKDG